MNRIAVYLRDERAADAFEAARPSMRLARVRVVCAAVWQAVVTLGCEWARAEHVGPLLGLLFGQVFCFGFVAAAIAGWGMGEARGARRVGGVSLAEAAVVYAAGVAAMLPTVIAAGVMAMRLAGG